MVIHAFAAPVIFAALATAYFRAFPAAAPGRTAAVWVSLVIVLDLFVVAMLVERSLAMFESPLGTWIPFTLIFLATFVTGRLLTPGIRRLSRA